ncbi:MAG: hypothetical protein PHD46_03825, partial [Eubacteriales bacterium]|nr:hypothetical protein [Eubacteriales bacterium]
MKKNRLLSFLLVLTVLTGLLGSFPALSVGAIPPPIQISNREPAILATVNTAVNLADYSVELDDGTILAASNITWYNESSPITSFTPSEKGVTKVTAKSKSNSSVSKNIYIVAKATSDTEYVLYNNDFSSSSLDGWNTSLATGLFSVSNGKLSIDATSSANLRIFLPAWLADFANYRIDAVGTQTNPYDTSRWFSVIFRAQPPAASITPYYHMCIRNNMMAAVNENTGTGGIECVSHKSSGYTYYTSTSYTESISAAKNYTFSVLAKDRTVQYQVNGDKVIHFTELPSIATTTNSNVDKGYIGFQVNKSKLILDSVKVTIQETAPVPPVVNTDTELVKANQPESNTLNHITNIGIVQSLAEYQSYKTTPENAPATLIFYANGVNLTTKNGTAICTISELMGDAETLPYIPAFYVKDNTTVDSLVSALKSADFKDVLFISDNTAVAKYARQSYNIARSAIDFSSITGISLTDEQLLDIRGDVKSAL